MEEGKVVCGNCGGTKVVETECEACFSMGSIDGDQCEDCDGEGKVDVTCPTCGGTGEVTVEVEN